MKDDLRGGVTERKGGKLEADVYENGFVGHLLETVESFYKE